MKQQPYVAALTGLSAYEGTHLISHCLSAGRAAEADLLLRLETPEGKNAWHQFKNRELGVASFLADVALVWAHHEHAEHTAGSPRLSTWLRYALITASVNSLAAKLPGPVLVEMTMRGLWSAKHAVAYAARVPDPEYRIRTLACLQGVIADPDRETAREILLAEVLALPDGDFRRDVEIRRWTLSEPQKRWFDRATALALAAPHLPPRMMLRAIQGANGIANPSARADALAAMASFLHGQEKQEVVRDALKAIGETRSVFEQVRRLAKLLPELDAQHFPLLFEIINHLDHDASQGDVLADAAEHMPPDQFDAALSIAKVIKWNDARIRACSSLLRKTPAHLLDKVYSDVAHMSDPWERGNCLIAMAQCLAGTTRATALSTALDDIIGTSVPADDGIEMSRTGKVSCLIAVAKLAEGADCKRAVHHALEGIAAMETDFRKAELLGDLAPFCTPETFPTVLRLMDSLKEEEWRLHAVEYVAPAVPPDIMDLLVGKVLRASSEYLRVAALVKIILNCSDMALNTILAGWDSLSADSSRATLASALVPRISPTLRDWLLSKVRDLNEPSARYQALIAFAPYTADISTILYQALEAATQIVKTTDFRRHETDCLRFEAFLRLATLIPEQQEHLCRQALDAARHLSDVHDPYLHNSRILRPEALLQLIKQAPDHVLSAILDVAFAIEPAGEREAVFQQLAPGLSVDDLQRLVSEVLRIGDTDARIRAQIALVRHLPLATREPYYSDIIRAIAACPEDVRRVEYLSLIADDVPASLLGRILSFIQDITDKCQRHRALFTVTSRLPVDLLDHLFAVVDTLNSWELPECLIGLANQYPDEKRHLFVAKAVAAARAIDDPSQRAERLWSIAKTCNAAFGEQLFTAALSEVTQLSAGAPKAKVLAEMVDHLPLSAQADVFEMLTVSICDIEAGSSLIVRRSYTREQAIADCGRKLPLYAHETLLRAFQGIDDHSERSVCLSALSTILPDRLRRSALEEALEAVHSIDDLTARVRTYLSLMPWLKGGERDEVFEFAFLAAKGTQDAADQARYLTRLLDCADVKDRRVMVDATFDAAMRIWTGKEQVAALQPLLEYLDESQLARVLAAAQHHYDTYYRAVMVNLMAPVLSQGLSVTALEVAKGISSPAERSLALAGLGNCPHADLAKVVRRMALQDAMSVDAVQDVSRVCSCLAPTLSDDELVDAMELVKSGPFPGTRLVAALYLLGRKGKSSDDAFASWILDELAAMNEPPLVVDLLIPGLKLFHESLLHRAAQLLGDAVQKIELPATRYSRYEDVITAVAIASGSVDSNLLSAWLRELGTRSRVECLSAIRTQVFTVNYVGRLAEQVGKKSEIARHVMGLDAFLGVSEEEVGAAWQSIDDVVRWWA